MSRSSRFDLPSTFRLLLASITCAGLAGCGMAGGGRPAPVNTNFGGLSVTGNVHGGQQPVAGSQISLYAAGKTGTASAARSMLTLPVTTDANGNFTITEVYTCNTGDQVYIVASGGSAGSGTNSAIMLMAALGSCSTLQANASTMFLQMNEVTTVGSVFALANFMSGTQNVGSASDTTNSNALAAAFANTQTMVSTSSGQALQTSTGNGIVPQTTINSLANSLAGCVNSMAANSTACSNLFSAATVAGSTPTDTLQAALNIAHYPTTNPSQVYAVASPTPPFQPTLSSAPSSYAIVVLHPSDVLTYHNDNSRDGAQTYETTLTPTNVNSATFGKRYSFTVDSYLFAQPLYVGGEGMPDGVVHNLLIAASTHGTVYAFDADGGNPAAGYLWSVSLVPSGERYPTGSDYGCNNPPEAGIVGTPVIDRATGTIYVVVKTIATSGGTFYHRLHAISMLDGSEKSGSPTAINPTFTGTGAGAGGGVIAFDGKSQNERSALLLAPNASGGKTVWVSYASHCDIAPYHGDILGFDSVSLANTATFIDTPNGDDGGIWMNSGGLAADTAGYIYALTGNGTFDVNTGGIDYGDAALKLSPPAIGSGSTAMAVSDYFVPSDQAYLDDHDLDVGGAEGILVSDPGSGIAPNLLIASDKNGAVYLINTANMSRYDTGPASTNNDIQDFTAGSTFIYNFSFFNNMLYTSVPMKAYAFTPGTLVTAGTFNETPVTQSNVSQAAPVVSANGTTNILVWAQDTGGELHAYTSALSEIYNSSQAAGGRDTPATYVKFTSPLIANGKVFLSGQGAIAIYGPLP